MLAVLAHGGCKRAGKKKRLEARSARRHILEKIGRKHQRKTLSQPPSKNCNKDDADAKKAKERDIHNDEH